MPISPENMALYPGGSIRSPEWLQIRQRIRDRARDACEGCGVRNGAIGGWGLDGSWCQNRPRGEKLLGLDWPQPGEEAWCGTDGNLELVRVIRIVCTVAHFDGQLVDHSDGNLRFWCQRCHNRHDASRRASNAAETRRKAKASGDLLGGAA